MGAASPRPWIPCTATRYEIRPFAADAYEAGLRASRYSENMRKHFMYGDKA